MKKSEVRALDELFSKRERLLSGGYCRRCKKCVGYSNLDTAHCHSRTIHNTRWDRKNVAALCRSKETGSGCHSHLDLHPNIKHEFFRELLGKDEYDKLYERSLVLKPHIDVKALKQELKEEIGILERG